MLNKLGGEWETLDLPTSSFLVFSKKKKIVPVEAEDTRNGVSRSEGTRNNEVNHSYEIMNWEGKK